MSENHTLFRLPDLGEGLTEAEIHEWHVKEGDEVNIDQPLVSMETAKAVVDVPSPCQGRIEKLHGKVGDIIQTDGVLVTFYQTKLATDPADKKTESTTTNPDQGSVVGQMHGQVHILEENATGLPIKASAQTNIRALPAARLLAKQKQIDLTKIKGTGPNDLITLRDVEMAASGPAKTESVLKDALPLRGVRRIMAQSMRKSHEQVVAVTVVDDAYLHQWQGQNDITIRIIRALIAGCHAEPALNAWFDGDSLSVAIQKNIHVGLAMDSDDGLFVPVIKNADQLSPTALREIIQRYKQQVGDRSIPQDELQGSTIMLSNFGVFAGKYANPIIVPPNVAILGVGRLRETPIVNNGVVCAAKILPLSLTIDHRAVTGGEATRFLAAVIKDLELNH